MSLKTPLEDGQYRWIKKDRGSIWEPARADEIRGWDFLFTLFGEHDSTISVFDTFRIGPVIQPPKDI